MRRLLCIGGPNVGHYMEVPESACQMRSATMPKLSTPSCRNTNVRLTTHTYRVESMWINSQKCEFLVHNSMRGDWLFEVIQKYAKRHKRAR